MSKSKVKKRDSVAVALAGLPLVTKQAPVVDLAPGPAETASVVVSKTEARLCLAKVEWVFDLLRPPCRVPLSLGDALAVGTNARPEAVSKIAKDAQLRVEPRVEYGIHTPDLHEYFVSKANGMTGVVHVKRKEDGSWSAGIAKTNLPYVLSKDAVDAGVMPPDGKSGLPATLEGVVPAKFQYWKHAGPQALAVRNALVESEFFPEHLVKVVDGDFRLCVERLFLYEPGEADLVEAGKEEPPTMAKVIHAIVPPALLEKGVCTPLDLEAGKFEEGKLAVLSPPDFATLKGIAEEIIKGEHAGHWLLEYDDTPEALAVFKAVGRVFKVRVGEARGRIFASSFEPAKPLAKYVPFDDAPVAVIKPFAGFTDFDACVAAQKKAGHGDEAAHKICGSLQADAEKALVATTTKGVKRDLAKRDIRLHVKKDEAPADDERYVLGVVLEPETIDAQQDIYSADEVRNTAYKFMEEFRTIGLMHKGAVNDKVKILESFVAPVDMEVGGQPVKKGTWVMGIRVLDDELWKAVKAGELTGFSIGGSALRKPDSDAANAKA